MAFETDGLLTAQLWNAEVDHAAVHLHGSFLHRQNLCGCAREQLRPPVESNRFMDALIAHCDGQIRLENTDGPSESLLRYIPTCTPVSSAILELCRSLY